MTSNNGSSVMVVKTENSGSFICKSMSQSLLWYAAQRGGTTCVTVCVHIVISLSISVSGFTSFCSLPWKLHTINRVLGVIG